MIKRCQWPKCTRPAIWNVHTANDSKGMLTCVWHYGRVMGEFRKLGHEPTVDLVNPPAEEDDIARWENEGGS